MKIARPSGGFKILIAPTELPYIQELCGLSAAVDRHWRDILDRLRFTAHVEGVEVRGFAPGHRLWVSAPEEDRQLPRIRVVYLVLGDKVTIKVISVD